MPSTNITLATRVTREYVQNSMWNINIIRPDPFRFPSDCFAPYVGKVGTKNCTSICDVSVSHRAVFQKVKMYQTLEILLRGRHNHAHQAVRSNSLFNLLLGIAFVVVTDSSDRCLVGQGKRQVCIIHKDVGSFRIVLEVEGVKTLQSRFELYYSLGHVDSKDTTSVKTVVDYPEFLAKAIERQDIGNHM
jgi:hypothetical protein